MVYYKQNSRTFFYKNALYEEEQSVLSPVKKKKSHSGRDW